MVNLFIWLKHSRVKVLPIKKKNLSHRSVFLAHRNYLKYLLKKYVFNKYWIIKHYPCIHYFIWECTEFRRITLAWFQWPMRNKMCYIYLAGISLASTLCLAFFSTQSQFWFHGSLHLDCISHSSCIILSFISWIFFQERVASDGYLISSSYLSEDKNFSFTFLLSISFPYSKALVELHEIPISQARVLSGC